VCLLPDKDFKEAIITVLSKVSKNMSVINKMIENLSKDREIMKKELMNSKTSNEIFEIKKIIRWD
jgi:hypothetical protein